MGRASKSVRLRRVFNAEFKLEAVRPMDERRGLGVSLAAVARELDVRPDMLRLWAKQADARAGAVPRDVFPGQGRLPTEPESASSPGRSVPSSILPVAP
jgi:transposase-like protein